MKYKLIIELFLFCSNVFATADLKFSNEHPSPGDSIKVTYFDDLIKHKQLDCYVYYTENFGELKVKVLPFVNVAAGVWMVNIPTSEVIQSLTLNIRNGLKVVYANNQKYILFYKNGVVLPNAKASIASILSQLNYYKIKWESDIVQSRKMFSEEFKVNPELKRKYFIDYLYTFDLMDKKDKFLLEEELKEYAQIPNLDSREYSQLFNLYGKLGKTSNSQVYFNSWLEKFPSNQFVLSFKLQKYLTELNGNKDFGKQIDVYENLKKDFSFISDYPDLKGLNIIKSHLLKVLGPKYIENDKFDDWENELINFDIETKSGTYFITASHLFNQTKYLEQALILSKKSIETGKLVFNNPRDSRTPMYLTDEEVLYDREKFFAFKLSMYGKLLEATGQIDSSIIALKDAAITYGKMESNEINKELLETLIGNGRQKEAQEIYLMLKKNEINDPLIDAFFNRNESEILPNIENYPKVKLIKRNLPDFHFVNEKGEEYDKGNLKGKTVVLDFWATWCSSCIAKFNSMNSLVEHYKNDNSVVFLFVDTNEKEGGNKKKALDLIMSLGFDFQILFDEENAALELLDVSSLPTVMVIDKESKVRFVEIGFNSEKGIKSIYKAIEQLK